MDTNQIDFFSKINENRVSRRTHGGQQGLHRRKLRRPLDSRKPLHVCMRSARARGQYNLLRAKHRLRVEQILRQSARRFHIKIHRFSNVGNHLHLLLTLSTRLSLQNFLRTVTGRIARLVTGARKGNAFGRFWDALVWSRIVSGRRDFKGVIAYLRLNDTEAERGRFARSLQVFMQMEAQKEFQFLSGNTS